MAGTARYESRSVADFSAISEQAERENRVSPRLSVGRHYETEPDSKLVQFFGPNEDMARYMATVVALQGSEVLRYELTISKSGFEEIVKVTML